MNLNLTNILALVGKANKQKESGGKRVLTSQKHDGKSATGDSAKKKQVHSFGCSFQPFFFLVTKNSQNAILKIGLLKVVKKKCGEKIIMMTMMMIINK